MNNKWQIAFLMIALLLSAFHFACDTEGDDDDDDSDVTDDDDDSGPTDDNARESAPEALVITTENMENAWRIFADWKDLTGIRTDVVLIEDVLAKNADAPALKAYLAQAYQDGIQYVLLAGDADQIPFIRGYTEVWALEKYYGNAPIQAYFEDLDHDWDADGDGQWGELDEDISLEDLRTPEISVGRVPVEDHDEAMGYINKLIRYESAEGVVADRAACPIFLGDVAASVPIVGDIDGGIMHEQLIADYIPENMRQDMRRLYGTQVYADLVGAEVGTEQNVLSAFENEGYAFSVTNTHGNYNYLTNILDIQLVEQMTNPVPFVFVTTSCLSGNFIDIAWGNGDNDEQTGQDSVAEELVKNPNGGAVAYVGNTLIGLGPVGGVQFNHSICRALFTQGVRILGDAIMEARRTVYEETAYVDIGQQTIEFPMTWNLFPGTEWYTQRSIILLGDPTLRVWRETPSLLTIQGPSQFESGYNVIEVTVTEGGVPASGKYVRLSQLGGVLIEKLADAQGKAEFKVELEASDTVTVVAYSDGKAPAVLTLNALQE